MNRLVLAVSKINNKCENQQTAPRVDSLGSRTHIDAHLPSKRLPLLLLLLLLLLTMMLPMVNPFDNSDGLPQSAAAKTNKAKEDPSCLRLCCCVCTLALPHLWNKFLVRHEKKWFCWDQCAPPLETRSPFGDSAELLCARTEKKKKKKSGTSALCRQQLVRVVGGHAPFCASKQATRRTAAGCWRGI